MLNEIEGKSRYIACARVTRRPIFEFVVPSIRPNDALMVFPFDDDYSFGILQSVFHWEWFVARCSTMKGDFRYTSNTVFDSFPWPQEPTPKAVGAVAKCSKQLRSLRKALKAKHGLSLRDLYRSLEQPGNHPLRDAQAALDHAVRGAYGFASKTSVLTSLLKLNHACAAMEAAGKFVRGPGYPGSEAERMLAVSSDAIGM
jgi:hypothetical protein